MVMQHNATLLESRSITLCGLTTSLLPSNVARIVLSPTAENGLREHSAVMIDKITTVRRDRIREHVGDVSAREMRELDEAVRRWLDL